MGQSQAKPDGGRMEAATQSLIGDVAISSASWFYITVIGICFLGLSICFCCEKYRRWLLGLDEKTNELERETLSEMTSLNEPSANVGTDPST